MKSWVEFSNFDKLYNESSEDDKKMLLADRPDMDKLLFFEEIENYE